MCGQDEKGAQEAPQSDGFELMVGTTRRRLRQLRRRSNYGKHIIFTLLPGITSERRGKGRQQTVPLPQSRRTDRDTR